MPSIIKFSNTEIKERLQRMNANFGAGDIIEVRITEQTIGYAKGIATQKLQYGQRPRRFRISNETIFFLNHQSNLLRAWK